MLFTENKQFGYEDILSRSNSLLNTAVYKLLGVDCVTLSSAVLETKLVQKNEYRKSQI